MSSFSAKRSRKKFMYVSFCYVYVINMCNNMFWTFLKAFHLQQQNYVLKAKFVYKFSC